MAPVMMDPVHAAIEIGNMPRSPSSYNGQNNGFTNSEFNNSHRNDGRLFNSKARSDSDADRASMIWVNGLHPQMPEHALIEALRQFGTVTSVVRKSDSKNPTGAYYAFVKFASPQEAQFAVSMGEIDVRGCRVIIKPRNSGRNQRHNSNGSTDFRPYDRSSSQGHSSGGSGPIGYDGNADSAHGNVHQASGRNQGVPSGPPVLMSKALTVANLPPDMCPKTFYNLFSEVGPVEGCYIWPHVDHMGRRYAHIVMNSFFVAQKAVEYFHGRPINGYPLDVTYLKGPVPGTEAEPLPAVSPPPGLPAGPTQQSRMPYSSSSQNNHQFYHPQHQQTIPVGWPQQGMGNISPPFNGMPSQYSIPPQQMMPIYSNQTNGFQAPMVPRYSSPPPVQMTLPTPSPPQGMRQWSMSQERKQYPNRQPRRYPVSSSGMMGMSPIDVSAFSRPEPESRIRSIPNSGPSSVIMESSLPRIQESKHEKERNASRYDNSTSERDTFCDSAIEVSPVSSSATPAAFDVFPTIPEASKPVDPCNLFVKNLDDTIVGTSEDLQKLFEPFGAVASAHLATFNESKISKGFGFVAFKNSADAAKAKEKMNNSLVGRKRVFVSYAERKEDRAKRLKSLFSGPGADTEEEEEKVGVNGGPAKPESVIHSNQGAVDIGVGESMKVPDAQLDMNPRVEKVDTKDKAKNKEVNAESKPAAGMTEVGSDANASSANITKIAESETVKASNGPITTNSKATEDDSSKEPFNGPLPKSNVSPKSQNGGKNGSGAKKNHKKSPSQKNSGGQAQSATPTAKANNSVGRTSKIPINKAAPHSSTGIRVASDSSISQAPSTPSTVKKRTYKSRSRNIKNGNEGTHESDVAKPVVNQTSIPVSAH